MTFFSVSLLKKCLDKRYFYPTFFVCFIGLFFLNIFDLLIPDQCIGKIIWLESLIFLFGLISLSFLIIILKKKTEEKLETGILVEYFQPMSYFAIFSLATGGIFLFIGLFLQFLQSLPFLGSIFKILLSPVNLAFYLIQPIGLISVIVILFCLGKIVVSGKKIAISFVYEEILAKKGQEVQFISTILKACLPLFIFSWFFSSSLDKIVFEEKKVVIFLIKLVLSLPCSLFLSPLVNYFFFYSFLNGEKNKVVRQGSSYSTSSR